MHPPIPNRRRLFGRPPPHLPPLSPVFPEASVAPPDPLREHVPFALGV